MKRLSSLITGTYKLINSTGILEYTLVQSFFTKCYYVYKRTFEDNYANFVKHYPILFSNGHVLDVGANIGYTAYIFSKVIDKSFKIYAFEPEKRNFNILNNNIAKLGLKENIIPINYAVGEENRYVSLWQNDSHHADHRIITPNLSQSLQYESFSTQTVSMTSIDNFVAAHNILNKIAFIKIDVQGYELKVCEGMIDTLKTNPNCTVAFEYCPSVMESLGYNAKQLISYFLKLNFKLYKINRNGRLSVWQHESSSLKESEYFDVVCSKLDLVTA